jgi:hypothetical protein
MEEGTHDGLPCLVPVTAQTYLRSIPTPTADMNHGQRFGDMHIGPMLCLTPARKALMRRASKPRCTSFPKILLILSFRESWGLGTWDWSKGESESGKLSMPRACFEQRAHVFDLLTTVALLETRKPTHLCTHLNHTWKKVASGTQC